MTYGENYPTSGAYGAPTPVHPGDLLPRFFARVIDGIIVGVLAFFGAFSIGSMSDIMVTGLFSGRGIVNTCGSACFRRPPFQLIRSVPSPPTG